MAKGPKDRKGMIIVRLWRWVLMAVLFLMMATLLPFHSQAQSKVPEVKEEKEELSQAPVISRGQWKEGISVDGVDGLTQVVKGKVRCRAGPGGVVKESPGLPFSPRGDWAVSADFNESAGAETVELIRSVVITRFFVRSGLGFT